MMLPHVDPRAEAYRSFQPSYKLEQVPVAILVYQQFQ